MMTYKIIIRGVENEILCDSEDIKKTISSTDEWVVIKAGVFQRRNIDGFVPNREFEGELKDYFSEMQVPQKIYKNSLNQLPAFTRRLPGQQPARLSAK